MGTSLAYSGSTDASAKDLRDLVADWLDDARPPSAADDVSKMGKAAAGIWSAGPASPSAAPARSISLPTAFGGGSAMGRSAARVAHSAGQSGSLANAYLRGDRAPFDEIGVDFDQLRALNDPAQVVLEIVAAGLERVTDETLADAEEREIVAHVVQWVLEFPASDPPSAEDTARKTIEEMIAYATLTEVGDTIRSNPDRGERRRVEGEIKQAAEACAAGVSLPPTGATRGDIERAVNSGIADLVRIYGDG